MKHVHFNLGTLSRFVLLDLSKDVRSPGSQDVTNCEQTFTRGNNTVITTQQDVGQ